MKKITLIILTVFILFSCSEKKNEQQEPVSAKQDNLVTLTNAQLKNAGIATGNLEPRNISSVLRVNGKIDVPPANRISVSVPLGGYIKSTSLLPGMPVRKGQVLATIEDPQYIQLQQDYLTAKAQLAINESEYNRQRDLNQSKAASDKVYEQAKAAYQTQNVLVHSLAQKLILAGLNPNRIGPGNISRSIQVTSPIDGFVAAVNVNMGKYVNPADVLFELVNPNGVHLSLTVFEKDVNQLSIGQKLVAYSNTDPDKKYSCTIMLINRNLSGERAVEVHCHFDQYDQKLLPGMFMNAEIETTARQSNALPEEAVVRFDNKEYVFAAKEENNFEMLEVQTGTTESGYTAIISPADLAQKKLVVKGAYSLLMALKNVNEEE
ncbi:efflux RND transporter periplasmic adaptor subunit [Niabella sp. CJ426]|uniref:efflux RND transporter periplasmic adaptor subunit n=1 Tax=Niabella sp. CJ426 TaxID=3393740 RepID=UPI003D090E8C